MLVWRSQTLAGAGRVWNQAYIRICSAATMSAGGEMCQS